jgi:hypothetical protein
MILLDLLLDSVATSSAYWQLMMNFTWTSTRKQQTIVLFPEWGGGGERLILRITLNRLCNFGKANIRKGTMMAVFDTPDVFCSSLTLINTD